MSVHNILQFVDNLVFAETNEHLNDLQKNIIQGLLNGHDYKKIADTYGYDEGYIGDLSRKLYKTLSTPLGEDINKSNFCWTIERVINNFQFVNSENNNIHYNYCPSYDKKKIMTRQNKS